MNAFIDIDPELDDEVRRGRRGPPARGRTGPPAGRKPQPAMQAPPLAALRRRGAVPGGMARPICHCPAHGDEFVRWVQSTLNRTQGLRLPVDGAMGPATRSALRAYQQQQGLPADGIAGPDTEQALLQGGAAAPLPAADSAPAGPAAEDDSGGAAQELEWLDPGARMLRPLMHASHCGCAACRPQDRRPGARLHVRSQRGPEDPEFEFLGSEWEGEVNRSSSGYIRWVQASLNRLQRLGLAEDGISGPLTRSAVRSFQSRKGLEVDGIVGPVTEAALVAAGAGQPPGFKPVAPPSAGPRPAPAGKLSGAHWVEQFPTSRSTTSLVQPFRANVDRFLAALRAAGATVSIAATQRPPQRAWLMHYAYQIAINGMSPAAVPRRPEIDIQWVHTDAKGMVNLAASRAAAQEMVDAYAIRYEPALTSKHIDGSAIDMTITWSGSLSIRDGKTGALKVISSSPKNGADNRELHAVGAGYGVIKLVGDPPHWSDNGH
jgi:peptidoglycan hydrolase-like protein with peptidoglycan-binding domain